MLAVLVETLCLLEWIAARSKSIYSSDFPSNTQTKCSCHACPPPLFSLVLKNIGAGPLKTIIFAAFSLNLTLTYIIMLVPPREYIEELVVRSNRYD